MRSLNIGRMEFFHPSLVSHSNVSNRFSFPLLAFSLLASALIGCADESIPPGIDAGPPPVDQCIGASDLAVAEAVIVPDSGASYSGTLGEYFSDCAFNSCLQEIIYNDGFEPCMGACIDATAISALSAGCRDCFLDAVRCVQSDCVIECVQGADSECDACIDVNCDPPLFDCGGFSLVE